MIGGCQLHNLSLELLPQQFHLLLIYIQYYSTTCQVIGGCQLHNVSLEPPSTVPSVANTYSTTVLPVRWLVAVSSTMSPWNCSLNSSICCWRDRKARRCLKEIIIKIKKVNGGKPIIGSMLRIHDILVWIWIQIHGSMPLTNGSGCGCGSFYFHLWPSRFQLKTNFKKVFSAYFFWRYFYIVF